MATTCAAVVVSGCGGSGPPPAGPGGSSVASSPPPQVPGAFDRIPSVVRQSEPTVVTIITPQGLGSGVVWSSDGVIVTDNHVIAGNSSVQVAFADGRRSPGTVRGSDPTTDLAVVQTDRKQLPKATFQRALPAVGELSIALGSPLGFQGSATSGIVSGVHRQVPGSAQQGQPLVDLIQTDAPISPGNSGGALLNAEGQVIGINEAYLPPSSGAVSIGFAIPAGTVVDVVGQLLATGHARHAFFGVQATDITPETAAQLGINTTTGVVVLDVVPGGPAAGAGIQPGDVITAVNGQPTDDEETFLADLRQHQPSDVVTVTVTRNGAQQQIPVTLSAQPTGSS